MDIKIRRYIPDQDYENLLKLIRTEGEEWDFYTTGDGKIKYRKALQNSLTYVVMVNGNLSAYCRSINDSDLYIWVIDLLVQKEHRGHSIGKMLMERLNSDFPDQETFVLSDVDQYYQKLGYTKEGTVFKVS